MNKEELAIAKMHENNRKKREHWESKHPLVVNLYRLITKFKMSLDNK